MGLTEYWQKRDFTKTREPRGKEEKARDTRSFVIQKHAARKLHYDFRLEAEGVLKSWAVPKGPSQDPEVKRLAVQVEDHPLSYKLFEGHIPEGEYGGGDVIVWDTGTYEISGGEAAFKKGLEKGRLTFVLRGKKVHGTFSLIRFQGKRQWLLKKRPDKYASLEDPTRDIRSAVSSRTLADPEEKPKRRGKKRASLPYEAMLATLVDAPFDDPDWVYEVKWDGYRIIADVSGGTATLWTRNGNDVTEKYQAVADALGKLGTDAVLDGELVALDPDGKPSFQMLQNAGRSPSQLTFYAFDLLSLDGEDLREDTLIERKACLKKILPKDPRVRFSSHTKGRGTAFFEAAQAQELEGIIAKRADSTYQSGRRSDDWRKIKTTLRQEAVIVGFTEPKGSRQHLGSLILALRDGDRWRYAGNAGTGFNTESLRTLSEQLKPLIRSTKPIEEKTPYDRTATWVEPKLICEVKFSEWTEAGEMRHPVFMGLRDDKRAGEVTRENDRKKERVPATNLKKVLFPKDGYTKGDVIKYYESMADTMLPYLMDRPMVLNRHPNGIGKKNFYQKNVGETDLPEYVRTVTVHSESTGEDIKYLVCANKETLLYMANLGCIEMNPWNSRAENMRNPDWYVIDLDPGDNTFEEVITVAKAVKEVLDLSCERSFVKTSGKTGLHIYVPLAGKYDFDQVRQFAELVARLVHQKLPELTSIERDPRKRKDLIYIDYLQNRFSQTLAAPYSLRPIDGANVSAPLEWKEVKKGLRPSQFTMKTIRARLRKKGDLWKGILGEPVDLKKAIECLRASSGSGTRARARSR